MSLAWLPPLHWACVALAAWAAGCVAWWLTSAPPRSLVRRWRSHVRELDGYLAALRWKTSGAQLAWLEVCLVVVGSICSVCLTPVVGVPLACLPGAARPWLEARVATRLQQLDMQLEGWVGALAGGLSSGASLGQALEESISLVEPPLRDEVLQACREMALGSGVSESLRRMAHRLRSATLSTAIAAIRIGQRGGGGLAHTLRESAAALKEMARLEGVVRTRTAEARAQASVVALIPPPMVAFIHHLDPTLMAPLWKHDQGWIVTSIACGLWVGSVALARRILRVDI